MTLSDHPTNSPAASSRRCWRCLQDFACSSDEIRPGATEWWLCDPCQVTLIGPRPTRTPGDG